MPQDWLKTLFQKWQSARGSRLTAAKMPFSLDWENLLDEAGLKLVEDRKAAEKDLRVLAKDSPGRPPRLLFKPVKYRHHLIEKVIVPLASEPWLMEQFGHTPAASLQRDSLAVVQELTPLKHPLLPTLWSQWCQRIQDAFQQGKNLQPLTWKEPSKVAEWMRLVHAFTSVPWAEGTKVRDASSQLNLIVTGGPKDPSKILESLRLPLESCLTNFYERPTTLESCGLVLAEPKVEVAGRLTLHFADGSSQPIQEMRGVYTLPLLPDLERAISISTCATRLLTVENSKTTLPALAAKNTCGDALLVGCSFPNRAVIRLIELLPSELPLHHFGDTDPAGFLILATLRQKTGRGIRPFLMNPRPSAKPVPFTEHDQKILPRLLQSPFLSDLHPTLETLMQSQDKGLYEQENLGTPDLPYWPFYAQALSDG